jgi:Tol biopolymer transport system component
MTIKYLKIALVAFLLVMISGIGYLFFVKPPPVDPEADRIAFLSESSSPGLSALFLTKSIYVSNIDSPGLTRVIQPSSRPWGLAWSPEGDRIVYYEYDTRKLYMINGDRVSTPELLWHSDQGIVIGDLSWSPAGSAIAFSSGADIYILDLTTQQITQLLDGSIPILDLSWSPSGDKFAFTLTPAIKTGGGPDDSIGIMDIDASEIIQLTPNDKSRSPDWSPDGKQIAFVREGNIYVMNGDGTNIRALIQDGHSFSPTWSPDGTRIAFISTKHQHCGPTIADALPFCTTALYMMDADGSNVELIRNKKNEQIRQPVWAPKN